MSSLARWRPPRPHHVAVAGVCVLAGLLFATSADTARGTDLRPGERGDLTNLVREEQARIAAANARVREIREQVQQRTDQVTSVQPPLGTAMSQAEQRELARLAGLEPLPGPGLTVVLDDAPLDARAQAGAEAGPDDFVVHQQDVQAVVNALWAGGAQGLQLMDQRVISTSAVRCVGSTLLLQGRIYPPPYRITAVGPVDGMLRALETSPDVAVYRQYVDLVGLRYDVSVQPRVTLPAYQGSLGISLASVPPSRPPESAANVSPAGG